MVCVERITIMFSGCCKELLVGESDQPLQLKLRFIRVVREPNKCSISSTL